MHNRISQIIQHFDFEWVNMHVYNFALINFFLSQIFKISSNVGRVIWSLACSDFWYRSIPEIFENSQICNKV